MTGTDICSRSQYLCVTEQSEIHQKNIAHSFLCLRGTQLDAVGKRNSRRFLRLVYPSSLDPRLYREGLRTGIKSLCFGARRSLAVVGKYRAEPITQFRYGSCHYHFSISFTPLLLLNRSLLSPRAEFSHSPSFWELNPVPSDQKQISLRRCHGCRGSKVVYLSHQQSIEYGTKKWCIIPVFQ